MRINKISVENFRSIEALSISCTDFNIFVGQNNSGKTNFFEAVDWFFNGPTKLNPNKDIYPCRDSTKEIKVTVTFAGAQHGVANMKNAANSVKMNEVLNGLDEITVVRSSLDSSKRHVIIDGVKLEKLPTGFDKAFNDFLPRFEYIHTRQYFDEMAKYSSKSPVGVMLSSVMDEILQDNPKYVDFKNKFEDLFEGDDSQIRIEFNLLGDVVQKYLKLQFEECASVKFEVASPEFDDLLKGFQTKVNDGVDTYAYEKGDGLQRALMLAIIQAYADYRKNRDDAGKSFIFFIDEAELHLHPAAQRKLKDVLLQLCDSLDQVFINTHSSVFLADDHQLQSIHKVTKEENKSNFTKIDDFEKPYVVFELLGGSPSDLLLPRNFLIVEGPSEVELLTRVIKRFYREKPSIQIISAEGDTHQAKRSIISIKKAFEPLKVSIYEKRLVVLCDKPSSAAQGGFDDFRSGFKEFFRRGQVFVLQHGSIEECYPASSEWVRSAEQVSNMSGRTKVQLAKRVGNEIDQHQFETEMAVLFEALSKAWDAAI